MRTPRSTFGAAGAFPFHRRSLLSCSGRRRRQSYAQHRAASTAAKPQVTLRSRRVTRLTARYANRSFFRAERDAIRNTARMQEPTLHFRAMLDAKVDHVAIAVRAMRPAMPLYTDALGAQFLFAGERTDQGFLWAQFGFPAGGKIELVTPLTPDGFVARFLERRGEGVHHATLNAPDLHAP